MKLKKIAIIIALSTICITGCNKSGSTKADYTDITRRIEVENKEHYKEDALKIIHGEIRASDSDIFVPEFEVKALDQNPSAEIREWYIFNNALYIQIGSDKFTAFMYRFQFNNDNIIDSYIKYSVIG